MAFETHGVVYSISDAPQLGGSWIRWWLQPGQIEASSGDPGLVTLLGIDRRQPRVGACSGKVDTSSGSALSAVGRGSYHGLTFLLSERGDVHLSMLFTCTYHVILMCRPLLSVILLYSCVLVSQFSVI